MKNSIYLLLSILLFGCATEEQLTPSFANSGWLNPNLSYGSVTDCSGNTYATIEIGNQEWMAENLRTTCYSNGNPILNVTDSVQWNNSTTGAWAYYHNDSQYESPYGKLYNWYAVVDPRNVCPSGWHVPSDAEWNTLIGFLDPSFEPDAGQPGQLSYQSSTAGSMMKSTGTEYWQAPNMDATNETGFSGLGAGNRSSVIISFNYFGIVGRWWSSTERSIYSAWLRYLWNDRGNVSRGSSDKDDGFSVRCLRD